MSFAFGFSGDDIDGDDEGIQNEVSADAGVSRAADPQDLVKPKLHSLSELLSDLPSQITYNCVPIPWKGSRSDWVARRSVFDIRTQLMAEASTSNDNDALIASLSSGDLSSGSYEGGFKTWDCALDLADFITPAADAPSFADEDPVGSEQADFHVIELGAGSAIPSLHLLRDVVRERLMSGSTKQQTNRGSIVQFTLADYNLDVLKLCTAPNVFLNSQFLLDRDLEPLDDLDQDHEIDLENLKEQLSSLPANLARLGIDVNFVSGTWGDDFVRLVTESTQLTTRHPTLPPRLFILASEAIYAPSTLPVFTSTVLSLLHKQERQQNGQHQARALIAAKRIYFGVGGGVAEFQKEVAHQDTRAQIRQVWESTDGTTVGRVVLEVTLSLDP